MSVVSSTSGLQPKENGQIQHGEHRPLGGNPEVNLMLYIWQPVAYLKNNPSWAVVSTRRRRAAGCSVSREVFVVYFTEGNFLQSRQSVKPKRGSGYLCQSLCQRYWLSPPKARYVRGVFGMPGGPCMCEVVIKLMRRAPCGKERRSTAHGVSHKR